MQAQPCGLIKTRSGVEQRWAKKKDQEAAIMGVSIGGCQGGKTGVRRGKVESIVSSECTRGSAKCDTILPKQEVAGMENKAAPALDRAGYRTS